MHHDEDSSGRSHWDELAQQLGLPPENAPAPANMKQTEPSIYREVSNREDGPKDPEEKLADTLPMTETPSDREPGPEDERPARRRRGRRGGRRHREGREVSGSDSGRGSRSSGRGDKRPRRARRSRPAEEPETEDAPDREVDLEQAQDEQDLEPQAPPSDSGETDDEEIEKISDWNVPSWAEIVSGLNRP
jgi:hypothetical protein